MRARGAVGEVLWVLALLMAGCEPPVPDGAPEPTPEPTESPRECNGLAALCERTLDEVTFLRTHNSHASDERGYSAFSHNHYEAMPTQLADGVRALNLDVYREGEEMLVCHGYCALGSQPLAEALAEVVDFVDADGDAVVLLSLQNEAPWERTVAALEAAGVAERAWVPDEGMERPGDGGWPSLAGLLDGGTPLVLSAGSVPGDGPAWLLDEREMQWGDHWAAETPADLDCEAENPAFPGGLYFFNNVLTAPLANPELAAQVNQGDELLGRLRACGVANAHLPNIVSVDFYSVGDPLGAVRVLNAEGI